MSNVEQDRRIEDYVDGRLPADERAAFERRLAEEPELARRVAFLRDMGRALRQEPRPLDPAFYTRLRAEFEARRGRRRFRLVSWETAGLAAAAAIVGALFVPVLLRDELEPPAAPQPVRTEAVGRVDPAASEPAPPATAEPAEPEPRTVDELRQLERELEPRAAEGEAPAPPRREPTPPAPLEDADEYAPAPPVAAPPEAGRESFRHDVAAPGKQESRERAKREEAKGALAERAGDLQAAPAPPARSQADAAAPAPSDESVGADETRAAYGAVAAEAEQAAPSRSRWLDGVALPDGIVAPGELAEIVTPAEWDGLLAGPAGRALSRLGPFDPAHRLVLVGPRATEFVCERAGLFESPQELLLRLAPPRPGETPARFGCAFVVPRDGRGIRVGTAS